MATIVANASRAFVSSGANIFVIPFEGAAAASIKTVAIRDAATSLDIIRTPREHVVEEKENGKGKHVDAEKFQILCSTISDCGSLVVVGTSAKTVHIVDAASLAIKRSFRIPKAPTSIAVDRDSAFIVVGDRAGHVCRYSVEAPATTGYKDITGEMSLFEGSPLTGAISMVLDVSLTPDGRYLLVADRDEKIRVSRYPLAYVVQSFCLGHTEYVKSVAVHGDRVFSAGGDGVVFEWNRETGSVVAKSEKLGDKPIRKIVAVEVAGSLSLGVIVEGSGSLRLISATDGQLRLGPFIDFEGEIQDVAVIGTTVVIVTKSSVFRAEVESRQSKEIHLPAELVESLEKSKDAIGSYFKNVTHQNMEGYHKRKVEKMQNEKDKKQRKRKARRENDDAMEEEKKMIVEE